MNGCRTVMNLSPEDNIPRSRLLRFYFCEMNSMGSKHSLESAVVQSLNFKIDNEILLNYENVFPRAFLKFRSDRWFLFSEILVTKNFETYSMEFRPKIKEQFPKTAPKLRSKDVLRRILTIANLNSHGMHTSCDRNRVIPKMSLSICIGFKNWNSHGLYEFLGYFVLAIRSNNELFLAFPENS